MLFQCMWSCGLLTCVTKFVSNIGTGSFLLFVFSWKKFQHSGSVFTKHCILFPFRTILIARHARQSWERRHSFSQFVQTNLYQVANLFEWKLWRSLQEMCNKYFFFFVRYIFAWRVAWWTMEMDVFTPLNVFFFFFSSTYNKYYGMNFLRKRHFTAWSTRER